MKNVIKALRDAGIGLSLVFIGLCIVTLAYFMNAYSSYPNWLLNVVRVDGVLALSCFVAEFVLALIQDKKERNNKQ